MSTAHWFWTILMALILLWYILVTVIVTIRGGKDVLEMVQDLKENNR